MPRPHFDIPKNPDKKEKFMPASGKVKPPESSVTTALLERVATDVGIFNALRPVSEELEGVMQILQQSSLSATLKAQIEPKIQSAYEKTQEPLENAYNSMTQVMELKSTKVSR